MTPTPAQPSFGIDAPTLVRGFALGGPVLLVAGILGAHHGGWIGSLSPSLQGTGFGFIASALLMVWSSRWGKRRVARQLVDAVALRGDEHVLDVGCGRGLLLLEAARRLPCGRATGIDLWSLRDQSGNGADATRANASVVGVAGRVDIDTGDMRELPYPDAHFDVVLSSLAVHNLPSDDDRTRAIAEIARVVKPGGRIALIDFTHTGRYAATLERVGCTSVTRSWPNLWMFPPVRIVRAERARPQR